jgi:hypothetical protein
MTFTVDHRVPSAAQLTRVSDRTAASAVRADRECRTSTDEWTSIRWLVTIIGSRGSTVVGAFFATHAA